MGVRSWFGRAGSQDPAGIARRYGLSEADVTEERVESLANDLRTFDSASSQWAAASKVYDRVLPAHLEAVHGQKRDREFRELTAVMLGRSNEGVRMVASLGIQQLHNEAHGID